MRTERDDGDGLPPGVAALWERREAQRARQHLSIERIIATAIELADKEGIEALSMTRLAERLGCATMSLYRHVVNKEELQMLMLDTASERPSFPREPVTDWRGALKQWATEFQDVHRRHPWILHIPMSGPPMTPGVLTWLECGLRILGATGLEPAERVSVMLYMIGYVRNEVQMSRTNDQDAAGYGKALAGLLDPADFPALLEMIEAGVTFREDFGFGFQLVLDSIETLIKSKRHGT